MASSTRARDEVQQVVLNRDEWQRLFIDLIPLAANANVVIDHAPVGPCRLLIEDSSQFRVTLALGRLIKTDSGECALLLNFPDPVIGPLVSPAERSRVHIHGWSAVYKDIVFDAVVVAREHGVVW